MQAHRTCKRMQTSLILKPEAQVIFFFSVLFQSDKIKKVWEPEYVFLEKNAK